MIALRLLENKCLLRTGFIDIRAIIADMWISVTTATFSFTTTSNNTVIKQSNKKTEQKSFHKTECQS